MNTLIIGIIVFFGIHLVPMTPLRAKLADRLGAAPYKGLFSLISVAGLGLMIWGISLARSGPDSARPWVYTPPEWGPKVTAICVLIALICLVASSHKGHLKRILKNPMSLGIGIWAAGHLFSNGSQSEVWFFGAFLVYALLDIANSTRKGKTHDFTPKPLHDMIAIGAGIVIYGLFFWLHPYIIGVPIIL